MRKFICNNPYLQIIMVSFLNQPKHIKWTYEKHVYQAMKDEYVISFFIHSQPFQLYQGKTSHIRKTYLFSSFHTSGTYVHTKQIHTRFFKKVVILVLPLCTIAHEARRCWYFQPFHLIFQYSVSKEDGKTNVTKITRENHVMASAVRQRATHITDQLIISHLLQNK